MLNNAFKRFIKPQPPVNREAMRRIEREIAKDIEEYLKAGGKITQVPTGESGAA